MPVYVTEFGEFSTKTIGDIEVVEMENGNWVVPGNYALVGSFVDESAFIMKYGVVYKEEYMSKERFCENIRNVPKIGSNLILRLMEENFRNFAPFGTEDDLTITARVIEIK